MEVYVKLVDLFNERKIKPSKFLLRAIENNKDYENNKDALETLIHRYANAIKINKIKLKKIVS
jgi:hypothetical protein